MHAKFTLLFAAVQAGLAVAGNAIVSNRCPYDVWVWSVSQGSGGEAIQIPSRTAWQEPLKGEGAAVAIKVSKSDQLMGGQQTQLEYTIGGGNLWYDISLVDCAEGESGANCPGWDMGFTMEVPSDSMCGKATCEGSTFCTSAAYFVPQPLLTLGVLEPVFTCPSNGQDLQYTLCSDEAPIKRSIAGRLLADTGF